MASEEELGLALRSSDVNAAQDSSSEWSGLPPELLEMIGSKLTEGAHLHNAALVCKSWSASIPTGLTALEVDMHSEPAMWVAKVDKLTSLVRHLRCVVIHVNAAISEHLLTSNVALVQQLISVTELKLHLREGCDLPAPAAAAIGSMSHITSLSIVGGGLKADAAASLLKGLAAAAAGAPGDGDGRAAAGGGGGGLRSLTLLPAVPYGLGDVEMELLAAVSSLEVLEFRSYRLTSSGLATLSLGLPRLTRLAISSLDSDSGYELACLERLEALRDLDLALEAAPTAAASRAALCAALGRPGRSLSLSFRWTDKAQGLLTEYGNRLANLTHLDVGACRVGSATLFEAVAQLTGLRELRMAVYSNADHAIPCHLSRLSALAALQRFHLEKRKAYFPEARRFGESSIAVPVTAEGLRSLAGRWTRLRSLRLALSRKDYSPEALSVLASFSGLRELGILVERHPAAPSAATPPPPPAAAAAAEQSSPDGGSAAAAATAVGGRLARRAVELPPLLNLSCLPPGLHSLELNNLLLDLSDAPPPPPPSSPSSWPSSWPSSPSSSSSSPPAHYLRQPQPQSIRAGTEAALAAGVVAGVPPPVAAAAAAAAAGVSPPAAFLAASLVTAAAPPGLGPGLGLGLGLSSPSVAALSAPAGAALQPALPAAATAAAPYAAAAAAAAATAPPPLPLPLSQLTSLDVEACVVRPPLLAAVAARCGGSLRSLRLVGVVGLSDPVLAECLPPLRVLRSLSVSAPGNRAVTQASLAALSAAAAFSPGPAFAAAAATAVSVDVTSTAAAAAGLPWRPPRPPPPQSPPPLLRQLSWESDDLTARGPDLLALSPLTALRHLYLSCTDKTAERALGSLRVLQDALPYCHVDMVWTAARPGEGTA